MTSFISSRRTVGAVSLSALVSLNVNLSSRHHHLRRRPDAGKPPLLHFKSRLSGRTLAISGRLTRSVDPHKKIAPTQHLERRLSGRIRATCYGPSKDQSEVASELERRSCGVEETHSLVDRMHHELRVCRFVGGLLICVDRLGRAG